MSKVGKIQADVINETYININLAIKEAYKSLVIHKSKFYKTKEWWSKELKDFKKDMLSIKMKFRLFKSNIINDEDALNA
jgi:hypothetical protein